MQLTLSARGQIVLPAAMRRRLHLQSHAKVELEEREGGIFIRPTKTARLTEAVKHSPAGSLKFGPRDYALDRFAVAAGEDDAP